MNYNIDKNVHILTNKTKNKTLEIIYVTDSSYVISVGVKIKNLLLPITMGSTAPYLRFRVAVLTDNDLTYCSSN